VRELTRAEVLAGLAAATLVGLLVRALPVVRADFPLHDGGLLYAMAGDLRLNGFALPAFTTYNGGQIPFAYPPLALYLAAGLNALGLPLLTILQYLPLFLSVAGIPLVFLVVRELLSERHALVAAFAFALMPSAYDWIIVGGGLTRAVGLVLGLLTIWQATLLATKPSYWRAALAGVLGGLTVLAHPYAAAFAVVSVGLIFAWRARSVATWRSAGVSLAVAAVVVIPWVWAVASQHGLGPLLSGSGSRTQVGVSVASLLFEDVTGATFSVFLGIALIGFLVELARGRWLLPVWLVLTFVVLVGGGWIMPMLPMAMLIGVAIVDAVVPGIITLTTGRSGRSPVAVVLAGLLCAGLLASLGVGYVIITPLWSLSAEQRAAMAWVAQDTPASATFAVVTGQPWALDTASEWFPALSRRTSLGTAQGYEWTNDWPARVDEAVALQSCASGGSIDCLNRWSQRLGQRPNYVYIAKGPQLGPLSSEDCCAALRTAMRGDMKVVYDGPGATILSWSSP
jgi:Dolichyl-phosphate-mannose-protein mannosyltransferase